MKYFLLACLFPALLTAQNMQLTEQLGKTVLYDGKQMLGHVCVQLFEKIPNPVSEPELHAYVTNFYVIPEMRDRGLAKDC